MVLGAGLAGPPGPGRPVRPSMGSTVDRAGTARRGLGVARGTGLLARQYQRRVLRRGCTSLRRQNRFRPFGGKFGQQARDPGWARGQERLWPNGTLLLGLVVVSPGDPGSLPGGGGC